MKLSMEDAGGARAARRWLWLNKSHRGQVNSIDAMLALLIFAGLIVFFTAFWSGSTDSVKGTLLKNRYEYAALSASDLMVRSPGLPTRWETDPSDVQEIGLAKSENVLSSAKLSAFAGLPYQNAKSLLGIDSDFFFYVEDRNGSRLYEAGNPFLGRRTSVTITRFAMLEGKAVRVRLSVYG